MRVQRTFVVVALALFVAGCSSLNPFSSKAPARNVPAELQEVRASFPVKTVWSVSIGNAGAYFFSPAPAGDSIYVAATDGSVARIDAGTGAVRWRTNAGATLTAGVGADAQTVAVVGSEGELIALDANGNKRWSSRVSSEVWSAPAVGQGLVIVRSIDNRIAAFDAQTGERRWVVQRPAPALTLRSAPGLEVVDQTAIVALPGGRLVSLVLDNGGARWDVAVGDPKGTTELERISDVSGAPVIAGNDVCAVAYQGRVACFDLRNGTPRWARELSSEVGVGVDERFVYVADVKGSVTAFTRDAGVSAWRNTQLTNRKLSAPAPMGQAVAVGDFQGFIHFLSRDDGAIVARVATDGSQVQSAMAVADRLAVFQTKSGSVVALTSAQPAR